jgi:hypothetical protein
LLLHTTQPANEQGQPVMRHRWDLAQALPPAHARLAFFIFTAPQHGPDALWAAETVTILDREIRAAQFSPTFGAIPSPSSPPRMQ